MPTNRKSQVQLLQRRAAALREQLQQLSQQHTADTYRVFLLDCLCNSFSIYLATTESQTHSEYQQEIQTLLQEIVPAQQVPAQQLERPEVITIAPRNDPLALFNALVTQPPLDEAATLTSAGLAALLRDTVLQANMVMLQDCFGVGQQPAAADAPGESKLGLQWHRYLHMVLCLMMAGRPEVFADVALYDLTTLHVDAEASHAAQGPERLASVISCLGLAEHQLQDISAGCSLFSSLLERVNDEERQVQQAWATTQKDSASSTSSTSATSSMWESLSSIHEKLEAQDKAAERMQVLQHKKWLIRVAGCGWLIGCLSWEQVTRAHSLCWPYPLRHTVLAEEIVLYAQQKQQRSSVQQQAA